MKQSLILALAVVATGCMVPDVVYREDFDGEQPGFRGDHFTRYNGYENVAGTMEVSAVSYLSPDKKTTVTLVGAIHVGDAAYYRQVQKILDGADLVYFELVKPKDMPFPVPGVESGEGAYSGMADVFGLADQMKCVQYDRKHFAWLDMSAEDFSARLSAIIQRAGGRLMQVFGGSFVDGTPQKAFEKAVREAPTRVQLAYAALALQAPMAANQAEEDPIQQILGLFLLPLKAEKAYYRAAKTEKAFEDKYQHNLAAGLMDSESQTGQFEAMRGADPVTDILVDAIEELMAVVLDERNAIVVQGVMDKLNSGTAPKHVAIFYGAGHNPGIEKSFLEHGLVRQGEPQWMQAIEIRRDEHRETR